MKIEIRDNCKYFKGDSPCKEHKLYKKRCPCDKYKPINFKILIIKLGAAGDVIRTTPLLFPLKEKYRDSYIVWLTHFPQLIPSTVDESLKFELPSVLRLLADKFNLLINLDKDKEALSLANLIKAKEKKGFYLKGGRCAPINQEAEQKFLTGLDDDFSRKNKLSYLQEIFNICGFKFKKEKYILEVKDYPPKLRTVSKPIIGLNTGCGKRWPVRLWPQNYWIELVRLLVKEGFSVVLLGGESEDAKNRYIAKESNALYPGYFPLEEFISLVNECDLIVTQVTMALHIAIGLGKKIVLMNNIFNRSEFELYDSGVILEPDVDCSGCYKSECNKNCMEKINPPLVLKAIKELLL